MWQGTHGSFLVNEMHNECKNVEPYGLILNIHKSNVMVVVAQPPRVGSTYIFIVLANIACICSHTIVLQKKKDILPTWPIKKEMDFVFKYNLIPFCYKQNQILNKQDLNWIIYPIWIHTPKK